MTLRSCIPLIPLEHLWVRTGDRDQVASMTPLLGSLHHLLTEQIAAVFTSDFPAAHKDEQELLRNQVIIDKSGACVYDRDIYKQGRGGYGSFRH